jgi:Cdc6-like AAA superfamily ATPase
MFINPFENTKASYMSREEILTYWTDIDGLEKENGDNQIHNYQYIMNPNFPLPIFILGSKGSGKTHLLRFFSFDLQEKFAKNEGLSILQKILNDKYIGILFTSSSYEFQMLQSNSDEDAFNQVYNYYLNLACLEIFLVNIVKIFRCINNLEQEKVIISELAKFFFPKKRKLLSSTTTLVEFLRVITDNRMTIEEELLHAKSNPNYQANFEYLLNYGVGIFQDIIGCIIQNTNELKNIHVLFMIDEFENFDEYKQKYINTFLRHPKVPESLSIRICGRLYAVKTDDTFDDGEPLIEGAEKKTMFLDDILIQGDSKRSSFKRFAEKLAVNRINKVIKRTIEPKEFSNLFINLQKEDHYKNILGREVQKKEEFTKKLVKQLASFAFEGQQIEKIISNVFYPENLFLSKINFLLLYKSWNRSDNLVKVSYEIKHSLIKFLEGDVDNIHKTAISHHGADMLYQLFRDTGKPYLYCGFDSIVNMSEGNPRNFLTILSNLHRHCTFKGLDMFSDEGIPPELQNKAMRETSEWFWNDIRKYKKMVDNRIFFVVERLCHFFRLHRLSDKPVEKTLISFSFDTSEIDTEIIKIFADAEKHSIIIEDKGGKKSKNDKNIIKQYSINAMFSPKWGLPLQVGGTVEFSKDEIESLFLPDSLEWEKYRDIRVARFNFPFRLGQGDTLFGMGTDSVS